MVLIGFWGLHLVVQKLCESYENEKQVELASAAAWIPKLWDKKSMGQFNIIC